MTLRRKLAITCTLSWLLALLTWAYLRNAEEYGSSVLYIHWTFRVVITSHDAALLWLFVAFGR
jgi:hypothetical protein